MIEEYLNRIKLPENSSHKGQNGKVLIIGGSELFHAPLLWAAEAASRLVDMVHVASWSEDNQELMEYALKQKFWNGIVVSWESVRDYIKEDDVVLIGPGMDRSEKTRVVVNQMLAEFPDKKWVVDGGALQMVDVKLINQNMMVTPHHKEWERLNGVVSNQAVVLLKGEVDVVTKGQERVEIRGGNSGMTKGGTGDVLAGLAAGLAAKNELMTAAVVASKVNKLAGERLAERVGTFFNATDLVKEIPQILHEMLKR